MPACSGNTAVWRKGVGVVRVFGGDGDLFDDIQSDLSFSRGAGCHFCQAADGCYMHNKSLILIGPSMNVGLKGLVTLDQCLGRKLLIVDFGL